MIKFLIWSNQHGAWWAPGGRGYTLDITLAGRFSAEDAAWRVADAGAYGPYASDGIPDDQTVLAPEYRWDSGPPEPGSVRLSLELQQVLREAEPPQTPDAAQNRGWNSPRPA